MVDPLVREASAFGRHGSSPCESIKRFYHSYPEGVMMNVRKLIAAHIFVGGKKVRIDVVRNSGLCRLITKKDFFLLGNTLYLRHSQATRKVIMAGMVDAYKRHRVGWFKYYLEFFKQ